MPMRSGANNRYRKGVVLCGPGDWGQEIVARLLKAYPPADTLWVGLSAPQGWQAIPPRRIGEHLGTERGALVIDLHTGFLPDAFAAALGVLRGGGVLYLLLPAGSDWPLPEDPALARLAPWPLDGSAVGRRFFRRLRSHIDGQPGWRLVEPGGSLDLPLPSRPDVPGWVLNPAQLGVVEAIERVALGHARRPLVLLADRGRGKSTAIGTALARLLAHGKQLLLCAPSVAAVEAVFNQLCRDLPDGNVTLKERGQAFCWGKGRVRFRLPAEQLRDPVACDLLVIDEAAAVGLRMLRRLTATHRRLVFSTTVHGYEGSGRGFSLRFREWLRQQMPQMHEMTLDEPVRWAPGDPLEAWCNRALMLAAEPRAVSGAVEPDYRWIEQDELAADESLLTQVFGLLVNAHYQTRPSDLQQLLDAPGIHTLLAEADGVVLGVALLVDEGGFDTGMAEQVCRGERRPRGHLLLQSLAQHGGWCRAPELRALRVMRIAVQAQVRREGIGSHLLAKARAWGDANGYDLISAAFGLDAPILRFWMQAGYQVVRIGHRVDPASGAHSALLIAGLSPAGADLTAQASAAFQRDLPWRLRRELSDLPVPELRLLLRGGASEGLRPDERDLENVRRFSRGGMGLDDAFPSLWRWLLSRLEDDPDSADADLVRHLLQAEKDDQPDKGMVRTLRASVARIYG